MLTSSASKEVGPSATHCVFILFLKDIAQRVGQIEGLHLLPSLSWCISDPKKLRDVLKMPLGVHGGSLLGLPIYRLLPIKITRVFF